MSATHLGYRQTCAASARNKPTRISDATNIDKKTFDETSTKRAFELVGGRADNILSKKLVAAMIGVSVSTLDRMVKAGTFPPAQKISPRRVGWRLSTVQAWISSGPLGNS